MGVDQVIGDVFCVTRHLFLAHQATMQIKHGQRITEIFKIFVIRGHAMKIGNMALEIGFGIELDRANFAVEDASIHPDTGIMTNSLNWVENWNGSAGSVGHDITDHQFRLRMQLAFNIRKIILFEENF